MELTHQKTGHRLNITLRPFAPDDASAVIRCLQDAYGDTYVKPELYTRAGVLSDWESGALVFYLAQTDAGEIAGITASIRSPHFPGLVETGCHVIRRDYNGYGLALPLAMYQYEQAALTGSSGYFARALGCHVISQKTLTGMGFTHCGFLPNVYDKSKFLHHFQNGGYAKLAQTVAVRRGDKTDAGSLWMPEELLPLAQMVYGDLALPWRRVDAPPPVPGPGQWEEAVDRTHATLTLWANEPGSDCARRLADALARGRSLGPLGAVTLYIDPGSPGCDALYHTARELGFVFTGFLPCGVREQLILHHPLSVPLDIDQIPFLPPYEPFAAEIRRQSR